MVTAVALGKRLLLRCFLAVDLDRSDAGEVLLDQIAQPRQVLLLTALLLHHPAAEQAHHRQHHGIGTNGSQGQPGINRQHRRQRQAVGQQGVGQAEDGEAQQAADVLHIAGGPVDHITTARGLHPGRFLPEHVVEQALAEFDLHLAADTEHKLPRQQPHGTHGGGQQHDPGGLAQDAVIGEADLQLIDDPAHLHRDRDAEDVDHHQGDRAEDDGFAVRAQVTADQVQAHGRHAVSDQGTST